MMIKALNGTLQGLRFLEKNGTPVFACGRMVEDPHCLSTVHHFIREFKLKEDQRIAGFKSVSDTSASALHKDF